LPGLDRQAGDTVTVRLTQRLDRSPCGPWVVPPTGAYGQVPVPVIAQAWRGGQRQARLAMVLSGAELVVADAPLSRWAGELLGRARTTDVLDALVALTAQDRPGCEVLTSDPGDIHRLLVALNIRRTIRVV